MQNNQKLEAVRPESVPYIVYESERAGAERTIRRLIIAIVISIILLFVSNLAWLMYESQYDTEDYSVALGSDGNSNASYIGEDGDIYNGSTYQNSEEN